MGKPTSAETAASIGRRAELADLSAQFVDAFNRQSMDDVLSFFAEDAVYEDPYGGVHEGKTAIRASFEPVIGGNLGKIRFDDDDLFIDVEAGKVMDSWVLNMHVGEGGEKEKTMRGLDLLHFVDDLLVRKISYRQS